MKDFASWCAKAGLLSFALWELMNLSSCSPSLTSSSQTSPMEDIKLFQKWELQPGSSVSGYTVTGGLGDISIALKGNRIFAPYDGEARLDKRGCLFFSTPDIPAYLFRFCGITSPTIGSLQSGQPLAAADLLQFAALRRQSDESWAIVEPDKRFLQRALKP